MKKTLLVSAALATAFIAAPVVAQTQSGGIDSSRPNTRAARREADKKKNAGSNQAQTYPNAERKAPKQAGADAMQKDLARLFSLQEKNDSEDEIIALADQIIGDQKSNAFDKSSAAYLAGGAWQSKSDDGYAKAIEYLEKAVQFNGLHNNSHYQAMLMLAQLHNVEGNHDKALTWIDRFLSETKSEDSKALAIKNQILLGAGKPEQAIGFLEEQAKKNPNDKKLQMNLASAYQSAGQEAKAREAMDRMRKAGLFTESQDYDIAWRMFANSEGGQKQALELIEEGLSKGILEPGYDVYIYQAQTAYADGQTDKAIEAWSKGAPMGKDGQGFLNLSQALVDKERWAEAKTAAQSALDKGVKKPGVAWQVIGLAEAGLGNKSAATAAYREAAKHAETKKWADAMLGNSGK